MNASTCNYISSAEMRQQHAGICLLRCTSAPHCFVIDLHFTWLITSTQFYFLEVTLIPSIPVIPPLEIQPQFLALISCTQLALFLL